jgi:hypothetical protein
MSREKCRRIDCGYVFSTTSENDHIGYYVGDVVREASLDTSITENYLPVAWWREHCPRVIWCPMCKRPSSTDEPIPDVIHATQDEKSPQYHMDMDMLYPPENRGNHDSDI